MERKSLTPKGCATAASAKKRQTGMSVLLTRRDTSCISSRNRRDKDRSAPLSRQLSPALELRLARARSDIANPFADAAGGVRSRAPPQATAAVPLPPLLPFRPHRPAPPREAE